MNKEVSEWMKDPSKSDSIPKIHFIATRGYDSVVWNRLYSRDSPDFLDYEAEQASILNGIVYRIFQENLSRFNMGWELFTLLSKVF